MIGNVNTYLTNPGSNNPQKVIDYYSNSDFEYNIRVGDYCKVTLDSNLLYWISGIVVEIDEEENAFSIKDSNGSVTKISCDNICDIQSGEEFRQGLWKIILNTLFIGMNGKQSLNIVISRCICKENRLI